MNIGKIGGNLAGSYTNNTARSAVRSASQAVDDNFASKLEAAVENNDDKELKKACQEFESIMLSMMYKQMKATIIKSDLVEKDAGTEIFESMQDDNLMDLASKKGGFGLAESLYKQLSRTSGTGVKNGDRGIIQKDLREDTQEVEPVGEKNGK